MLADPIPNPPTPLDPLDQQRWEETRLRRRMLDGTWEQDLRHRLRKAVGKVRADAWGLVDLSANPFQVICRELAVLYAVAPEVRHDVGQDPIRAFVTSVDRSGLWAQMPRFQSWAIGCREYPMRVHVDGDGLLHYRPMAPDYVLAWPHEDDWSRPVRIWEARLRAHPRTGDPAWAWDVLDISDPDRPRYEVREAGTDRGLGEDWSGHYLTDPSGEPVDGWPDVFRRSDGEPILPVELYHASRTGDRLWDYMAWREIVQGALNHATNGSHLLHLISDASWPQRYGVDVEPAGLSAVGEDGAGRREVVSDAATMLMLQRTNDESQPMVSQWEPGADVEAVQRTIQAEATRLAQDAGIPPSDVQRMGGTARSGYAIALSNDGKRQAQRQFRSQFQPSDAGLMAISAVLLNRQTGTDYPEDGYSVIYQEIPLSPQELASRREHVRELIKDGLMSRLQAYQYLHPGISEEQARNDLREIDGVDDDTLAAGVVSDKAQDTALNGAQVTAATEIVARVSQGALTADMGIAMLMEFFNLPRRAATAILSGASSTRQPETVRPIGPPTKTT